MHDNCAGPLRLIVFLIVVVEKEKDVDVDVTVTNRLKARFWRPLFLSIFTN